MPALQYSRSIGIRTIVADYLPGNPGREIADEYYNISTVDKDAILALARARGVDAVCAYGSDPAAPTAAYVSEKLGLAGSPYETVLKLSNKELFRRFLLEEGFDCPWFMTASEPEDLTIRTDCSQAVLKPVDSSGSRGVYRINNRTELAEYFPEAVRFSKTGRVILEELIESSGPQLHGEAFVVDGTIVFLHMGDQYFSLSNPVAPCSTLVPSVVHGKIMPQVSQLIKEVVERVGYTTGGLNIEIIRDKGNRLFLLELGPRSGGNYMPQLMYYSTGYDLTKANIEAVLKMPLTSKSTREKRSFFAQIILHSRTDGVFQGIDMPYHPYVREVFKRVNYKTGQFVRAYRNSGDVIGVVIVELANQQALDFYHSRLLHHDFVIVS